MTETNPNAPRKPMANIQAAWKFALAWVMALPLAIKALLAAGFAGGFAFLFLFLGYQVNQHNTFPAWFFSKVDGKLQAVIFKPAPPEPIRAGLLRSNLIDLTVEVGRVNQERTYDAYNMLSESGGGLASFGEDVLLLPYNGQIYAAASAENIRLTSVHGPDIGRAGYLAAIDELTAEGYYFRPGYLRYNDLLHFSNEGGQGLIASFTEYHAGEQCFTNSLARLDIAPGITSINDVTAAPDDWKIIYRTKPCLPLKKQHYALEGQMASGRIDFATPSTVYFTSGDFHWDGMRSNGELIAQNSTAEYGKVLSVNIDTGEGEIVSMGHRNMQGIVHTSDGRVIVTEHGPNGGDELNIIEKGGNYGWPLASYGIAYSGSAMPDAESYGRHEGYAKPSYVWMPSVAISDILELKDFNEAWDGDLLAGSLMDQSLYRIRLQDGLPIYSERIPLGGRIRSLHQHTDGRIVAWTDEMRLVFISPRPRVDHVVRLIDHIADWHIPDQRAERLRMTLDNCAECHSYARGDDARSPSLGQVFQRQIASTSYPGYSDGLKAVRGTWTRENLTRYLSDPQAFAPGTTMPDPNISNQATMEDVINFLADIENDF